MENVRKPDGRGQSYACCDVMRKNKAPDVAKAANGNRRISGGGDLVDPRLFYFRALLNSDRFFSGGGRS